MALVHFLLAYDRSAQRLLQQVAFSDAHKAAEAYKELEVEHRLDENVEIVLIGSDSIETVMRTHSNYFGAPRSIEDLLVLN